MLKIVENWHLKNLLQVFIFTFSLHLVFYFVRPQKVATCWLLFTSHQAEKSATASSASLAELPCVCERLYNRMRWLVKLDVADTPMEINISDLYSISYAHAFKQANYAGLQKPWLSARKHSEVPVHLHFHQTPGCLQRSYHKVTGRSGLAKNGCKRLILFSALVSHHEKAPISSAAAFIPLITNILFFFFFLTPNYF